MKTIKSEAALTFWEASGIIIGHGVGSGILAVPYLASRNSLAAAAGILAAAYCINLLLHFMIAELSYNNGGSQLIKCFENELLTGTGARQVSWLFFALLGVSVIVNVSGFIVGAGAVLQSWFGVSKTAAMLGYYAVSTLVVFFGMKFVGICEKISVAAMMMVISFLFCAVIFRTHQPLPPHSLPNRCAAYTNGLVLYSMISFSLSAVMSVPQVVKGLNGDARRIKGAIAAGSAVNVILILLITVTTLLGAGVHITTRGALVDLSEQLGGNIAIIGYVFSLLALSTSFWANALNLRDVIDEQTALGRKKSWLIASLPCIGIALLGLGSFVGLVRFSGIIQVLTGLGVIASYNRSRKKNPQPFICGRWGVLPFQVLVATGAILATVGAVFNVY